MKIIYYIICIDNVIYNLGNYPKHLTSVKIKVESKRTFATKVKFTLLQASYFCCSFIGAEQEIGQKKRCTKRDKMNKCNSEYKKLETAVILVKYLPVSYTQ